MTGLTILASTTQKRGSCPLQTTTSDMPRFPVVVGHTIGTIDRGGSPQKPMIMKQEEVYGTEDYQGYFREQSSGKD